MNKLINRDKLEEILGRVEEKLGYDAMRYYLYCSNVRYYLDWNAQILANSVLIAY